MVALYDILLAHETGAKPWEEVPSEKARGSRRGLAEREGEPGGRGGRSKGRQAGACMASLANTDKRASRNGKGS